MMLETLREINVLVALNITTCRKCFHAETVLCPEAAFGFTVLIFLHIFVPH